ncbi:hypothetical protein K1719_035604 [Acacia pycnantha]|nr:hypothetical protein K1719_035604 [Acacia pycnantha]
MRLDRAISNTEWAQSFPHYEFNHLPKILSDHRPILINLGSNSSQGPTSRPFQFLASWLTHPEFPLLVDRIWKEESDLSLCIDKFTILAQQWNTDTFGAIGRRKRKLLNRIRGIQIRLEDPSNPSLDFLSDLDTSLREELEEVCFQEELLWIQKSSSDWLCLGDRNTHYYQMKARIRRKKNSILRLKNQNGDWVTNEGSLSDHAVDFFKDLYSLDDPTFFPLSIQGMFPNLSDSQGLTGDCSSREQGEEPME